MQAAEPKARRRGFLDHSQFYVSTGHLPSGSVVEEWVEEAYDEFRSNDQGENSNVYPALTKVPSDLFGICLVDTSGAVHMAGDAEHDFTIMSISKPFVFAL